MPAQTPYDEIPYPYAVRAGTHPARLGALARVLGRDVTPFAQCRVLEIGAGDGVNLINMALGAPHSQFVGVDISIEAVRLGHELIAETGTDNVRLEIADLRAYQNPDGPFDYIIAHGIYAWISEAAREALMRLVSRQLAPQGLALVSYNALPGCRARQAIRDLLLFELQGVDDPERRIAVARETLQFYLALWSSETPFAKTLAETAREMLRRPLGLLYHDELAETWEPRLVSEVAAHARRHGLDYLCDAQPRLIGEALFEGELWRDTLPKHGGDYTRFEQIRDFIEERAFHLSLFCRADDNIDRRFDPARLGALYIRGKLEPLALEDGEFGFKTFFGGEISTDDSAFAQHLLSLAEIFPAAERISTLTSDLRQVEGLMRLCVMGALELLTTPFRLSLFAGERPLASRLARAQARRGALGVSSLMHTPVALADEDARRFLTLLDGTRTATQIAGAMAAATGVAFDDAPKAVEERLANFCRCGLIEEEQR